VLIQKYKIRSQGALPGSRDLLLNIETPLISLERLKIQTSNFAGTLTLGNTKRKNEKNGQKGLWPKSRDLLFKFWDPPNISEMAEDTNLKFCMLIEGKGY